MYPMKILKLIFLSTIITLLISCTNNLKQNKIKFNFEPNSNFGRFLSARYSLKVGDNKFASKFISKSKDLHLDLTLAKLNFNSYLINGDFHNAKKFKLTAPNGLEKLPMYGLPDFVINLKKGEFFNPNNFHSVLSNLPGFEIIMESINNIKLVKSNNYESFDVNLKNSNVFNLLIFENTEIETLIHLSMKKENLSLIENILYLGYLNRKNPETFNEKINSFSLRFNYDIDALKLYFENENNVKKEHNNKFILANLFSYLSFISSSQKNIPNSYLKILNEISHFLEPNLGNSNYFLANIYSNENNFKIALNKLNRIKENSFMYPYSMIKKYKILKKIDEKSSILFLKSIEKKYPKNNEILLLIANKYRSENKCDKAIEIYDKLIKKNINKNSFYYLKAICLDKLNKWNDSKKILIELISKNPNDAYVLNYLSYSMAVRSEDLIKAKELIIRAIEIDEDNGFFLDTLGWIQFKLNDTENAIRTIQLAIELEPNNSEIIDHLGDIYYKVGRKKEAIYEWNKALNGNANNKLKEKITSKLKKYKK